MPCGFYLLSLTQDLKKINETGVDEIAATGMFMLVRRPVYEAVAGHRAVAGAISEDAELARIVKRAGGKVAMWDGAGLLETRMYSGWRSLRAGIAKNLIDLMGGPGSTIATAVLGLVLAWGLVLIPVASLLTGGHEPLDGIARALALGAAALALAFHVGGAAHFRIPLWYGLLFPLGYTAGAVIAFDSVRQRSGRVVWKGRLLRGHRVSRRPLPRPRLNERRRPSVRHGARAQDLQPGGDDRSDRHRRRRLHDPARAPAVRARRSTELCLRLADIRRRLSGAGPSPPA